MSLLYENKEWNQPKEESRWPSERQELPNRHTIFANPFPPLRKGCGLRNKHLAADPQTHPTQLTMKAYQEAQYYMARIKNYKKESTKFSRILQRQISSQPVKFWCGRVDSNHHGIATVSPSS